MSDLSPRLLRARVMHKRTQPAHRAFHYRIYYLLLPLSQLHPDGVGRTLALNRRGLQSFYEEDHGARDGSPLEPWLKEILDEHGLGETIEETLLLTMPRSLGQVFNPVSFWWCIDKDGALRAVLCEVNSTFGETHCYLCLHSDRRPIGARDWIEAQKLFHVSPFLDQGGSYRFRFSMEDQRLGVWIDYNGADGAKQLTTSLSGSLHPLTRGELRRAFWAHPFLSWKTLGAIYWQGFKLFLRGITHRSKPEQSAQRRTSSLTQRPADNAETPPQESAASDAKDAPQRTDQAR